MYLQTCTIRNIKCFEDVTLDFRMPDGNIRLWNVLIGENGTGKTTLLQIIALALMGETSSSILLPRPEGWVRDNAEQGTIEATIVPGSFDAEATFAQSEDAIYMGTPLIAQYTIESPVNTGSIFKVVNTTKELHAKNRLRNLESRHGWFAAGYGPFRRLSGGTIETVQMVKDGYRETRFITLFREDAALANGVEWLMRLDYIRRDDDNPEEQEKANQTLNMVEMTINTLLPEGWTIKGINSKGVFFQTPYAGERRINDLSDGYRAVLALALDLLQHLNDAYDSLMQNYLEHIPGVVLIDEIDAHLHPTWQRTIGTMLKQCFPKIQFIVATHSPFIPQMADDDGLYILRQEGNAVVAMREEQSVKGWRVDQILSIGKVGG